MESVGNKAPKGRPYITALTGFIVIIFAVIGFLAIINFFAGVIKDKADNKELKNDIAHQIAAVVLIDPPSMENTKKMSNESVIAAGIWNLVLHTDSKGYDHDEFNISVPATDVEAEIKKLFGKKAEFTHQSINSAGLAASYKNDTKTYSVPNQLLIPSYIPEVSEVSKEGDTYTVLVNYVQAGSAWGKYIISPGKGNTSSYAKSMQYVLVKSGKNYVVSAIREPDGSVKKDSPEKPEPSENEDESGGETPEFDVSKDAA